MRNTIFFTGLALCISGLVSISKMPQNTREPFPSYRLHKDGTMEPLHNSPKFEEFQRHVPQPVDVMETATASLLQNNQSTLKP